MSADREIPVHALVWYGTLDDCRKAAEALATPVRYLPGQFLFYEGHRPYGIYLLNTGSVEFYRTSTGNPLDEPESQYSVHANSEEGRALVIGAKLLSEESLFPVNARVRERIEGVFIDRTTLLETGILQKWLARTGSTANDTLL